jgi:hypothetical protein
MTDESDSETLTPREMSDWLSQELADVNKARDLRVKQATELVEGYHRGELSPEQATQALLAYDLRWGDALFGVHASSGMSDSEILKAIDERHDRTSHVRRATGSKSSNPKPLL